MLEKGGIECWENGGMTVGSMSVLRMVVGVSVTCLVVISAVSIPAVVNKLIKEMVPNIRVSNDARDLLLNCCSGLWTYTHPNTHTHTQTHTHTLPTCDICGHSTLNRCRCHIHYVSSQ